MRRTAYFHAQILMMKTILSLCLLLLLVAPASLAQQKKFSNAVQYNDYIVQQQQNILTVMNAFNETVGKGEKPAIDAARLRVVAESRTAAKNVRQMAPFKGQTTFRDAAVSLFDFYVKVTSTTYVEMIDLMFSEREDRADKINALVANITEDEKKYDEKFLSSQQAFAKAHDFRLE